VKTFVADNEGHIVFQFHDDGKSGTPEQREYVYAGGNPWAETGHGVDGVQQTLIDTGKYNLIENLGDSFPGGVLTYTTRDGDSLMAIAAQMYGNPSLWFVIADANGLNAGEQLGKIEDLGILVIWDESSTAAMRVPESRYARRHVRNVR
jgi:nucleoid-associated protein YgaU